MAKVSGDAKIVMSLTKNCRYKADKTAFSTLLNVYKRENMVPPFYIYSYC